MPKDPMTTADIKTFWNMYERDGISPALQWIMETKGGLVALEGDVKLLVDAARERDIDIIKFLSELDEFLHQPKEDNNDTNGTDNDGSELCTGSSGQANVDEVESGSTAHGADDSGADSQN
jgi:hypothetical protein